MQALINKAQVSTPSDTEVRVTRDFNAPRKLVWQAHADPKLFQRWIGGYPGWSMPVCEMDVRTGGVILPGSIARSAVSSSGTSCPSCTQPRSPPLLAPAVCENCIATAEKRATWCWPFSPKATRCWQAPSLRVKNGSFPPKMAPTTTPTSPLPQA